MNCFDCNCCPTLEISLLTCGHYLCSECYVNAKNNKIDNCVLCQNKGIIKKLKRGKRKNIPRKEYFREYVEKNREHLKELWANDYKANRDKKKTNILNKYYFKAECKRLSNILI